MATINYNKVIWEGWTVQGFIDDLEPQLSMIMNNKSGKDPLQTKAELKEWCMDNQPYYKKYIPEVVTHFAKEYNLK
jgi:hypothetical protein